MAEPIGHLERVRALAVCGRILAVGGVRASSDSAVTLFDHTTERVVARVAVPAHVHALAASDSFLVAACEDGRVRLFEASDGALRAEIPVHPGPCTAVAIHGDTAWVGGADGSLRRVSLADGLIQRAHALSRQALRAVAVDASGEVGAAGGDDGVVYTIDRNGAVGAWTGHDGPVQALAFTPTSDRLVSGGDDGTIRVWYVAGAITAAVVEPDVRGVGDDGHPGGVRAIAFVPGTRQVGAERIVTCGAEGIVRLWRFEQKRRSKKIHTATSGLYAFAWAPRRDGGVLFTGGDQRTVFGLSADVAGEFEGSAKTYADAFAVFRTSLGVPAEAKRRETVTTLAALPEPEALDLVLRALATDAEPLVRVHAIAEVARNKRIGATKALRLRLDDDDAKVRAAAFGALRQLETPLRAVRAALAARSPDVRRAAVELLPALAGQFPLASGLVFERLADSDNLVRLAAYLAAVKIEPEGSIVPLRESFERGFADVKCAALAHVALRGAVADPIFAPWVERALDDADATVRRVAFTVRILGRPGLARWLSLKDPASEKALAGLAKIASEFRAALTGKAATDTDEAEVRALLLPNPASEPPTPTEADREPLLAALTCRTADTSLRGATALAMLADLRALGALLTASRAPDATLRQNAALALATLDDPRARRRLVWMLNDPQPAVRDVAWRCLGQLESDPLVQAEMALRSAHPDLRRRGLTLLINAGLGPRQSELLADALDDEDPSVRTEAFRTLWAWHPNAPLIPLDRALKARFWDVRMLAVHELFRRVGEPGLRAPVLERLGAAIADREETVAVAAYNHTLDAHGKGYAPSHLAAMASSNANVRRQGAVGAVEAAPDAVRDALVRLLSDDEAAVRHAALDALDQLFPSMVRESSAVPSDPTPLRAGLAVAYLDTRVRAAELLAARRDESLVDPMFALLRDKDDLERRYPAALVAQWRLGAATALATLGLPRLLDRYANELVGDDDGFVREQGARGLSNACPMAEADRLEALLGHLDLPVRSWAAEGLARLGDPRGLPVLVGTLEHNHPPIRIGAILALAALGTDGAWGLLQGLEDASPEVQRILFVVLLARDVVAFRRGDPPDLLSAALSAARPETRFAAARALELRTDADRYLSHLVELLMPERPAAAADLARWPDETERTRLLAGLGMAVASEVAEQRYAALQALRLRDKPLAYFREAARVAQLRRVDAAWVPETTPRAHQPPRDPLGRLRRLFASTFTATEPPPPMETAPLDRVAFGAYVGLVREVAPDDEGHRVKRDAIDRIAEMVLEGRVGRAAAVPALARGLDDVNHLVRRAAFVALKTIHPDDTDAPLTVALSSSSPDVLRLVLDELAKLAPDVAFARVALALDSPVAEARRYAFDVLERVSPKGSLEPLLAALRSSHADMRIGVLERLASSQDPRVTEALGRALLSDHDDLRLRAAELLAQRKDDRACDVLEAALRVEEQASRARAALVRSATEGAVRALSARLADEPPPEERVALVQALGATRSAAAVPAVVARFGDEEPSVRTAAFAAGLELAGPKAARPPAPPPKPHERVRDPNVAITVLEGAVRARDPELRGAAARELDTLDHAEAGPLLQSLFTDRDKAVRVAAVSAYAVQVEDRSIDPAPLDEVLRGGARETMLAAARGLATRRISTAFLPLLLFVRAGTDDERPVALLSLGVLGDLRVLPEINRILDEPNGNAPMKAAALEALGRLHGRMTDAEERERARDRIEAALHTALSVGAIRGLVHVGGERSRARLAAVVEARRSVATEVVEACRGLGRLKDVASEPTLARALRSVNGRSAAYQALLELFPNERARVELHAVVCGWIDLAAPAAEFLAAEGDAGALLGVLEHVQIPLLRERLRLGLLNRPHLDAKALTALLAPERPLATRSDVAWLVGARSGRRPWDEPSRALLADPLARTARAASAAFAEQLARGVPTGLDERQEAWMRTLWAARRLGPVPADVIEAASASDAPLSVRVQAAHAGPTRATSSPDVAVRFAAAASGAATFSPPDPGAMGEGPAPMDALRTTTGRQAHLPSYLRSARGGGDVTALLSLVRAGTSAERVDAIGALSLSDTPQAAEELARLSRAATEPEEVRKAAFRGSRRIQRRISRKNGERTRG